MSDAPLIELCGVTVRFGGLTAVNGVEASVRPGQIYSIIGPNGAGKTTVFNVITGIYEPTEGSIHFHGREIGRPFTWRVILACSLIGLATAIVAALMALNIDNLWRATIRRNFIELDQKFSYAQAWRDAKAYVRGDLAVEKHRGRWQIMTADATQVLEYAGTAEEGEKRRAELTKWTRLAPVGGGVKQEGDHVRATGVSSETWQEFEATFPNKDAANVEIAKIVAIGEEAAARRRAAGLASVAGLVVGFAGAYVVWRRAARQSDVVSRSGLARTFQNIRLFQNMTVLENVLTGMDREFRAGVLAMSLRTPRLTRDEARGQQHAEELLRFVGLSSRSGALAKNLPYGDQRRLEIARALATSPELILLDEPAAGMNPTESVELTELIRKIRDRKVTVLLIEHHMKVVMGISDRIAVLDHGSKIAEGTPDAVRKNPAVIKAYLGAEDVH